MDRNRYAQENKEIYRQKAAEKNGRQETTASERQPTLTIHRTILKASVPKEAYDQWTEAVNDPSKRADVKAFYIKGMVKDGQGEPFNAWVKPNFERNKMDFFRWNPDRAKRQGAEVKPAVESRTQVAVNSEGKTAEAWTTKRSPTTTRCFPPRTSPPNWMPTTASSMRWSRGGCSKPFPGPA